MRLISLAAAGCRGTFFFFVVSSRSFCFPSYPRAQIYLFMYFTSLSRAPEFSTFGADRVRDALKRDAFFLNKNDNIKNLKK